MKWRIFGDRTGGEASGDSALIKRHVETYIGPIHKTFVVPDSQGPEISVLWIRPQPQLPLNVIVTSGMSSLAMPAPREARACTHLELIMVLPASWDLSDPQNQNSFWPVESLAGTARYPHQHRIWLWLNHTIPMRNDFTPFVAGMVEAPYPLDVNVGTLRTKDGRSIAFFSVVGLLPDEYDFLRTNDPGELFDLAEKADRLDEYAILTPNRRSVLDP